MSENIGSSNEHASLNGARLAVAIWVARFGLFLALVWFLSLFAGLVEVFVYPESTMIFNTSISLMFAMGASSVIVHALAGNDAARVWNSLK